MAATPTDAMSSGISIRRHLLRSQVVVILLLGGGILATTFVGARSAVESLSRSIIDRATSQIESELHRFFDPVRQSLLLIRQWAAGGGFEALNDPLLEGLLAPVMAENPQIDAIGYAIPGGTRVRVSRRAGGLEIRRTREPLPAWYPLALERFDADQASQPVAAQTLWTQPYLLDSGHLGFTAAVGLVTPSGDHPAVALDLPVEDLSAFVRGIEVTKGGGIAIMTDDGRVLALPDDPRYWTGRPEEALLLTPSELRTRLVQDAVDAFANRPAAERGTPVRFLSGGELWWSEVRRFVLADDRGVLVAVLIPNADLWADRTRLRLPILALTLAVLGGAIVHAYGSARRFSRPIEALVRESDRISQGDLEPRPALESSLIEVDRLSRAHERMRRGLLSLMKLERDLQLARQIQQSTLPSVLPEVEGFEVEAWNRPADATGGDTYDVIGLGPDDAGVFATAFLLVADASGHGMGPALSVTQVRAMLRMAVRLRDDLQGLASHLNDQLCSDLPEGQFVTAWLARLDGRSGVLTSFSAGQGPLLYLPAGADRVQIRAADVPPLGLFRDLPERSAVPISMGSGDLFVVASDGCFEVLDDAGKELGYQRFGDLLLHSRHLTAAAILETLTAALSERAGGRAPADDQTIVIVKRS